MHGERAGYDRQTSTPPIYSLVEWGWDSGGVVWLHSYFKSEYCYPAMVIPGQLGVDNSYGCHGALQASGGPGLMLVTGKPLSLFGT